MPTWQALGPQLRAWRRLLPCSLRPAQATSPGLSGIVEAQLGAALDKAQQCSAWGRRPLTPEQLRYAAADAACLLALLGDLASRAAPADYPLAGGCVNGALRRPRQQQQQQHHQADAVMLARGGYNGTEPPSGCSGDGGAGLTAAASPPEALLGAGGWMACGAGALQQAAEAWGSRLEVSGGRAVKQRPARRSRAKLRRAQEEGSLEGNSPLLPCFSLCLVPPMCGGEKRARN